MEYAIRVKGLTKHYKDFTLDNVSFEVPTGSIVGFIGENGAGKSTTIKAILDLIRKDAGTIELLGQENGAGNREIKEQIGVIFDECYFPDGLTVEDVNRMMKYTSRQWETETFFGYCKRFELPGKKAVKEFSRGMKVKLSIAAALSHQAKLIILDDACGSLDPVVRNEILDIFMDFIQEEEHSILLSSHITSDLEKIADHITFIHRGRLLMTASKNDLAYHYGVMRCRENQFRALAPEDILAYRKRDLQIDVLVRDKKEAERKYKDVVIDHVSVDEIMLLLVKGEQV